MSGTLPELKDQLKSLESLLIQAKKADASDISYLLEGCLWNVQVAYAISEKINGKTDQPAIKQDLANKLEAIIENLKNPDIIKALGRTNASDNLSKFLKRPTISTTNQPHTGHSPKIFNKKRRATSNTTQPSNNKPARAK